MPLPTIRGEGPDGILVLAKPAGPTSHDMVALVRRLSGTRRVGHGGTLDPFAAGVLPVFLGRATRLVEYHMGDRKAYRATVCLGASSTTDDVQGELTPGESPPPDRAAFEAALAPFRGTVEQRPPAYSALKVAGRRAYALAREGTQPELALRTVTFYRLDLVEWDETDPARPMAIVEVECSAGTYVRALARDLGERLGCGAYLGTLIRTASGPFRLDHAHDPDAVRGAAAEGPESFARLLLPIDAGLPEMPSITLTGADLAAATRGQIFRPSGGGGRGGQDHAVHGGAALQRGHGTPESSPRPSEGPVRLLDGTGRLVGIGSWVAGRIAPDKILVPPAPQLPGEEAEE